MAETEHLTRRRCRRHATREAAARCPVCRRYFCRECVTEHQDLALCVDCLAERVKSQRPGGSWRRDFILRPLATLLAMVVAWLFFVLIGWATMEIPGDFHSEPETATLEQEP